MRFRWPWNNRVDPVDPTEMIEAQQAEVAAQFRKLKTAQALDRRQRVVVHNHLAYDIRQALERRA